MSTDHTQQQSPDAQRRSQEMSLQKARPPGEVPGYSMQRLLGCGAYGEVWIAMDRNTGRRVAIKFYTHRSGVDWSLLSSEVEKLVYLSADRYVVQLLDVGWDAEPPYYVMDYIDNGSLEDLLRQHGPLPLSEATELFWEMAIGLLHAHGKGVLHCDLKPANVLLDQDRKPRLADFGQSRLSTDQSPALGTLFYMAPEQADLNSVPDARWDVYALGAILVCMLTGEPPFRSDEAVRRIEEARTLGERLATYQTLIRSAPPLDLGRRVRGVDRALAEIVGRCLAVNPEQRFANVQSVLDALNSREEARLRRPLMLLGLVGPVLLLLIMGLFAMRGYDHAVRDSEELIGQRARESNDFAAKFAARSIEGELERYFRLIRREAESRELYERFAKVAKLDVLKRLNDPKSSRSERESLRPAFIEDPTRRELNAFLDERLEYYLQRYRGDARELKLASLFTLDTRGEMLAAAHDDPRIETPSIGWNFAFRTYFHGRPADIEGGAKENVLTDVEPIHDTHLSAAFISTTTQNWKVAISTPIFWPGGPEEEVAGVLAITLNLGDFAYFRTNYRPDRFAVLIDGRPGPNQGVVLQHPLFDRRQRNGKKRAANAAMAEHRVTQEQLLRIRTERSYRYRDPMSNAEGGETFAGDWIAAIENVRLPDAPPDRADMIVLVQEKQAQATAPVQQLGDRLKREGAWAIAGMIGVIMCLWYIVLRMLHEPRAFLKRADVVATPPTLAFGTATLKSSSRAPGPR